MNVVMVGPFGMAPKSTMAVRALPMARALQRRGHSVVVLLPPWSNPTEAGTTFESAGVQVENVPLPSRTPLLFHFILTLTLLRRTVALKPAVVHCFKPKAYAGMTLWAAWSLRKLGMLDSRLVVDSDDWEGAGGWNDVESYSAAYKRFFGWQERWGLVHADAVTVASRALQTLTWSMGIAGERVHYVPNGVEPCALQTTTIAPESGVEPTLLLYTRFFEFGLERVARIFGQLAHLNPALHFLIVGNGLFGEERRFASLLQEAGCDPMRTTFTGWPPAGGLQAVFARATMAIFPFDDTLLNRTKCSVKLIELLAAGLPVVAEAVGQIDEYILSGESGLLVQPFDEAGFVNAVVRVLDDTALRHRLAWGAKKRMQGYFSWDDLVAEVEHAYRA
jgi:glycosyltransferase involved in cell wall biosynthesis